MKGITMKEIKKDKEFMCPYCGNEDDQETEDSFLEDEYYVYKMICPICNKTYTDYYRLNYETTSIEKEEK